MEYLFIKPLKIYNKDTTEVLDVLDAHKLEDIKYPDYLTVKFKYDKKMWWCYRDELLNSIHGELQDPISGTLALPGMFIHLYDTDDVKQVIRVLADNELLLDDDSTIPQESLDYAVLFRRTISLKEDDQLVLKSNIHAFPSVRIVTTKEIPKFIQHLEKYDTISFDTETLGLLPLIYNLDDPKDFVVSISLSIDANSGYFIKNDKSEDFSKLIQFLAKKHLVVHNASFDIAILKIIYGIEHDNFDDTLIIAKLLNENLMSYTLKSLAKDVLGKGDQLRLGDFDYLKYVNSNQYGRMEYLLAYYAASDTANTMGLYGYAIPKLKLQSTLYEYYRKIEIPSILPVAVAINQNGLTVDTTKLQEVKVAAEDYVVECQQKMLDATQSYIDEMNIEYYAYQRDTIEKYSDNVIAHFKAKGSIKTQVDEDITRQLVQNVNYEHLPLYGSLKTLTVFHNKLLARPRGISQYTLQLNDKQFMQELVYTSNYGLKLPLQRTSSGQASLNKAAIDQINKYIHAEVTSGNTSQRLTDASEFFNYFKEFTRTRKLLDAFILPTIELMKSSKDGKVHASYNLLGTVSGRASCNNPNFQQLADNKKFDLRSCFTVENKEKYSFIQADFQAQEAFLMALVSKDPLLCKLIKEGRDIHAESVRRVWPEYKSYSDERIVVECKPLRTIAKVILFALCYGAAPKKMAYIVGISVAEALKVLNAFKEDAYPVLMKWLEDAGKDLQSKGNVEILGGYKRRFKSTGDKWKDAGQVRSIVNSMIQGAGAYITKLGTLNVIKALEKEGIPYKLIILIHDSITIQVPDEFVSRAFNVVEQSMQFTKDGMVLKCVAAVNKDMSKNTELTLDEFLNELEDGE